MNYIKLKNFHAPKNREKILVNCTSDKELISRKYKEFQLDNKKIKYPD